MPQRTKPGGFSASGGVTTKLRLLNIERAKISNAPALFDDLPLAAKPRRRK
jgi:methylated-DNA-[protein]-cysteine S-methyltransferase